MNNEYGAVFTLTLAGSREYIDQIDNILCQLLSKGGFLFSHGEEPAPFVIQRIYPGDPVPSHSSLLVIGEGIGEEQSKRLLRTLPVGQKRTTIGWQDRVWSVRCDIVVALSLPHLRKNARGFKFRFRWIDEKHLWPGLAGRNLPAPAAIVLTIAAKVAHELGVSSKVIQEVIHQWL